MNSSDYSPIRVETSGSLFGLDPTQPGQERQRQDKNDERRSKKARGESEDPDAQQAAEDPSADQEDPHTVDYRA